MSVDALPRAHGAPVLVAAIRSIPEDFVVEELDAFAPSGSGEHLLLSVEKRGMNTAYAAKRIAAWAGVPESAIGYAGLKDRHALTRQRFSVHLPKKVAPDLAGLQSGDAESGSGQSLRVLACDWHARKLPRGALAGNRFVLTLRNVEGDRDSIEQRLSVIAAVGVPNYFGEQRFGRSGDNVQQALSMFAGRRVRREERSLLLSAARSELFNRVLAARVSGGNWNTPLAGEVWVLDGTRSVFGPEPWSETLAQRLAAFDIHPTAPLWGQGELRSDDAAAVVELSALDGAQALALRHGLEHAGLRQERRSIRLRVVEMTWSWPRRDLLQLAFELPPGSYATAVLDEIGPHSSPAP